MTTIKQHHEEMCFLESCNTAQLLETQSREVRTLTMVGGISACACESSKVECTNIVGIGWVVQ